MSSRQQFKGAHLLCRENVDELNFFQKIILIVIQVICSNDICNSWKRDQGTIVYLQTTILCATLNQSKEKNKQGPTCWFLTMLSSTWICMLLSKVGLGAGAGVKKLWVGLDENLLLVAALHIPLLFTKNWNLCGILSSAAIMGRKLRIPKLPMRPSLTVYPHADKDAYFYLHSHTRQRERNLPSSSLTATPKTKMRSSLEVPPRTRLTEK